MPRRMAWRVMMPKKISTMLSQDPRGRGEVQGDPGVLLASQACDLRVLVGGVVVHHEVQLDAAGRPSRPA